MCNLEATCARGIFLRGSFPEPEGLIWVVRLKEIPTAKKNPSSGQLGIRVHGALSQIHAPDIHVPSENTSQQQNACSASAAWVDTQPFAGDVYWCGRAIVYRATPDIRTGPATRTQRRSCGLWVLEPTGHSPQVLWIQDRRS